MTVEDPEGFDPNLPPPSVWSIQEAENGLFNLYCDERMVGQYRTFEQAEAVAKES